MIPIYIMQMGPFVVLIGFNLLHIFEYGCPQLIIKAINSCSVKHIVDIRSCTNLPVRNTPRVPLAVMQSAARQISEIADWSLMQISLLFADPSVRFTKAKCFLQRSPLRLSTVFSYSTVWALGKRTALYPWATRDVSTADFSALHFAVCWCELPPWDAWMVNKTSMNHIANLQQTPPVLQIERFCHGNQANHICVI